MSNIQYKPGTGFFDDLTSSAMNVSGDDLKSHAQKIADAYKGRKSGITVAVGLIQHKGTQMLVYTVSRNRTSKEMRAVADTLGITRWEYLPRAEGRGAVGAPGDAEQILFEAADANSGYKVMAVAPSRPACKDCALVLKRRGVPYFDKVSTSDTGGAAAKADAATASTAKANAAKTDDAKTDAAKANANKTAATTSDTRNAAAKPTLIDKQYIKKALPGRRAGPSTSATPVPATAASDRAATPDRGVTTDRATTADRGTSGGRPTSDSRGTTPPAATTRGTTPPTPPASKPSPTTTTPKAVAQKIKPISRRSQMASLKTLGSKAMTTAGKAAPMVAKVFVFYNYIDQVLSGLETIQDIKSQLTSGSTVSPDEQIAYNVSSNCNQLNKEANAFLDDVLDTDVFENFEQALESTDIQEVLSIGSFLVDIRSYPDELVPNLTDLNRKLKSKIEVMNVAFGHLDWMLTTKEGFATLTAIAALYTMGGGIQVVQVQAFKIHQSLQKMIGALQSAFDTNRETLFVLQSIKDHASGLDALYSQRIQYLVKENAFTGAGWAVDTE